MKKISIDELKELVLTGKKVFVKFSTEWCGQCKMTSILMNKLKPDYSEIEFIEVDVDDNGLWDHEIFKISVVPTFVGFNKGETLFNKSEYQVEEKLKELLNSI